MTLVGRDSGGAYVEARTAEVFTGKPGRYVKLTDTIRGFKEIADGLHDDIPEQYFFYAGGIEEVVEAAKKAAA